MSDWILYVILAGGVAFAVSSWWGVRRLRARHVRSAVREDAHKPEAGGQRVAVILNPVKNNAQDARHSIPRHATWRAGTHPAFSKPPGGPRLSDSPGQALAYRADVVAGRRWRRYSPRGGRVPRAHERGHGLDALGNRKPAGPQRGPGCHRSCGQHPHGFVRPPALHRHRTEWRIHNKQDRRLFRAMPSW